MYITGNNGGVFALNPTTGKQIWHYTPTPAGSAPSKGVAYGKGLHFYGQQANLIALNAKTGAFVWKTLVDPSKGLASPLLRSSSPPVAGYQKC